MHPKKLLAMSAKDINTGEGSLADHLKATAFLEFGSAGKNVWTY